MVSIQTGASLAKSLFPKIGPDGATALRLLLAAAALLVVWRPWRRSLSRQRLGAIAAYGAALGLMNLCFYLALRSVPLGVAVALEFTGPLGLALAGSRRPRDLAWALLAVGGVAALLPLGAAGAGVALGDTLLALAAGGFWAAYIVLGKRVGAHGHDQAISLGMLSAAVVGAPLGLVHAGPALWSWPILAVGAAVALLSSVIPYSLELVAMARLPTRTFGTLMSLEPGVAALAALALLGERLSGMQWLGLAAVIAASAGAAITAGPTLSEPAGD